MVLTDKEVLAWLGQFLWPFLRITGLFLTEPYFGSSFIPGRVKALLAACLAAMLAAWLPPLSAFPEQAAPAIYQGVVQIAFGATLGIVMQIVVSAVSSTGEIAGLAMGLSFAELQFTGVTGATQVLYDIMSWAALLGYIAVGGPVWLFAAIAHSFQGGTATVDISSLPALISLGGTIFTTAVLLALPVLAVSLSINVTVGLVTVFAPQLNLLTIGFPLLILGGTAILMASLGHLNHEIEHLLTIAVRLIARMISHG
jgi:flagellar biosynthetic protein FliR